MIGKIERVKLRDVWKHEAYDLTRWLQDNIDVLNEAIDLNISKKSLLILNLIKAYEAIVILIVKVNKKLDCKANSKIESG